MNVFLWGLEDQITLMLFILSLVVVFVAQYMVKKAFREYRTIRVKSNISGFEAARKILDANNLDKVHIVEVKGELNDHYDPKAKVVRLSTPIFHEESIAAVAVAAHEVGHAMQDKEQYLPLKIRNLIIPTTSFMSNIGYFMIIIGLLAGAFQLIMFGLIFFSASLIFQLVTLPVEFDASKRAKKQLRKLNISAKSEEENIRKMLNAAALTYVAAIIATILQIMRIYLMSRGR